MNPEVNIRYSPAVRIIFAILPFLFTAAFVAGCILFDDRPDFLEFLGIGFSLLLLAYYVLRINTFRVWISDGKLRYREITATAVPLDEIESVEIAPYLRIYIWPHTHFKITGKTSQILLGYSSRMLRPLEEYLTEHHAEAVRRVEKIEEVFYE
jgi:hypothetical protein